MNLEDLKDRIGENPLTFVVFLSSVLLISLFIFVVATQPPVKDSVFVGAFEELISNTSFNETYFTPYVVSFARYKKGRITAEGAIVDNAGRLSDGYVDTRTGEVIIQDTSFGLPVSVPCVNSTDSACEKTQGVN